MSKKVLTKAVYDIESERWLPEMEVSFDYDGAWTLCDRSAQSNLKKDANTANTDTGQFQSEGQAIQNFTVPALEREVNADHTYTPGQNNAMLTNAGAGAGGATSAFDARLRNEAARTGNTASLGAGLDASERGRQQSLAKASEGIAANDAELTQANKQHALGELSQYGQADSKDALSALGLSDQATIDEAKAGETGWFQNMNQMISTLGGAGKDAFGGANGAGFMRG